MSPHDRLLAIYRAAVEAAETMPLFRIVNVSPRKTLAEVLSRKWVDRSCTQVLQSKQTKLSSFDHRRLVHEVNALLADEIGPMSFTNPLYFGNKGEDKFITLMPYAAPYGVLREFETRFRADKLQFTLHEKTHGWNQMMPADLVLTTKMPLFRAAAEFNGHGKLGEHWIEFDLANKKSLVEHRPQILALLDAVRLFLYSDDQRLFCRTLSDRYQDYTKTT